MSNASFSTRENFLEMDWENTQRTFEVTQFGAMHVCQHAARQMVAQGDPPEGTYKLVLISSVMAELSHLIPSSFGYNMAKASLDTLAKSLASGMAQHSITGAPARPTLSCGSCSRLPVLLPPPQTLSEQRGDCLAELCRVSAVNAVAPGWIDTTGERQFTEADDMRMMARHLPFGIGRPEHVAKGVSALSAHTSTSTTSRSHCPPSAGLNHRHLTCANHLIVLRTR